MVRAAGVPAVSQDNAETMHGTLGTLLDAHIAGNILQQPSKPLFQLDHRISSGGHIKNNCNWM